LTAARSRPKCKGKKDTPIPEESFSSEALAETSADEPLPAAAVPEPLPAAAVPEPSPKRILLVKLGRKSRSAVQSLRRKREGSLMDQIASIHNRLEGEGRIPRGAKIVIALVH
jgi:hypothetical protein